MSIRRAIPVVVTGDPAGTRAFYEGFLGFRVSMEQDGFSCWCRRASIRRFFVREPSETVANVTTHISDLT